MEIVYLILIRTGVTRAEPEGHWTTLDLSSTEPESLPPGEIAIYEGKWKDLQPPKSFTLAKHLKVTPRKQPVDKVEEING